MFDGPARGPTYVIRGTCTADDDDDEPMTELVDVEATEGEGLGALNVGIGATRRERVDGCTPRLTHRARVMVSRLNNLSLISSASVSILLLMASKRASISSCLAINDMVQVCDKMVKFTHQHYSTAFWQTLKTDLDSERVLKKPEPEPESERVLDPEPESEQVLEPEKEPEKAVQNRRDCPQ